MLPEITTVAPHDYLRLASALGDTPHTLQSQHVLRLGNCRVYLEGALDAWSGLVIQSKALPAEPVGFGADPEALWRLVRQAAGWECLLVDTGCAQALGEIMARELVRPVRYLDDIAFTLTRPVTRLHHSAVRLLTSDDLELLEAAPRELRDSLWRSTQEILEAGVIACAIISGEIAATALVVANTARFAEIGVHTRADHRRQGLAGAAASLACARVQSMGQIPVWSAGSHNVASLSLAHKLGFLEVSRRRYVIPETAPSD